MILTLAVIVGLMASAAWHRGQSPNRIAALPLRSAWLALLAVLLQIPLLRAPFGPPGQVGVQQVLFLLSHLFLLAFAWRNRRLVGGDLRVLRPDWPVSPIVDFTQLADQPVLNLLSNDPIPSSAAIGQQQR